MTHPNALRNLRPWQKGQGGNPNKIYTRLPPELLAIKSLSGKEACKLISKYARMTMAELMKALRDKTTSVIELAIAEVFRSSIEKGDHIKLSFLLDRSIGKVKDIEIEDEEEGDAYEEVKQLSMVELLTLVKTNIPGEKIEESVAQGHYEDTPKKPPFNPS